MNKIILLILFIFVTIGCSFNKNSKFWTASQSIPEENNLEYKEIFVEEEALGKELNPNLKLKLNGEINTNLSVRNYFNNEGRSNFDGLLKKSSRYKFSKIKNFYQFEPTISFYKKNLIFFDDNGSILKFDNQSKLIWKKNYYSKSEKKLKPMLQFANDKNFLIVADNIAKYYALDLNSGDLLWSKNNLAPFNSQIKIFKEKIFLVDFSNTLRCFSTKDGKELWNITTDKSLIRSQKKLSIVIVNNTLYFNNSLGDINAVDINKGELLWQLPTQKNLIFESSFSLETSDIIADTNSLFFSNNKNQLFSIDIKTGSFNWENKINSNLRPSLVGNLLFTVSMEGYLIVIEKNTGNILRITDIFKNYKKKKRNKIKPVGFIIGLNNIYLSLSNGRLLVVDIVTGKTISVLKIDNEKISRPFVLDSNLFVIKDNAIIKLN
ncbi:PQQ-like beta-propeller repeat protein [Candidatus Pelagibacter sp.]|nr:PQQ-like beta-propeller repeat protein [Candidatus Pelagibacter sp.]